MLWLSDKKDYIQISNDAKRSTMALHLMGPAYDNLVALKQDIHQLQASHIDTTALNQEYQQNLQLFRTAQTPEEFLQLIQQSTVQLEATSDFSTQAIPYVGAAKLQQFNANIIQLKQYGEDTGPFLKLLKTDQIALDQAKTVSDYLKVSAKISSNSTIKRWQAGATHTSTTTHMMAASTTWITSMVRIAQGRMVVQLCSMRSPPRRCLTTSQPLILSTTISSTCARWRPITAIKRPLVSRMPLTLH